MDLQAISGLTMRLNIL